MKKFKTIIISTVFCVFFVSLFVCYDATAKGVTSGLYLCADVIIPSLFPLLCLISFFINTGVVSVFQKYLNKFCKKCFNMSGYFLPIFLISLISSYPVGAVLSNTLYENKKISLDERNNLALVCCSGGPAFILLAIGVNILNSFECGVVLICCHILASVTVLIVVSRFFKYNSKFNSFDENVSISEALVKGVGTASNSIISICAYTILFSAVINIISKYLRFTPVFIPLVSMLEVTNACFVLSGEKVSLSLICAVLGFGGFSVIFQVAHALKTAKPAISNIILVRLFHSLLSYVYCEIALKFVNISVPVIKNIKPIAKYSSDNFLFSFCLVLLLVVFLTFLNNSIKRQEN